MLHAIFNTQNQQSDQRMSEHFDFVLNDDELQRIQGGASPSYRNFGPSGLPQSAGKNITIWDIDLDS